MKSRLPVLVLPAIAAALSIGCKSQDATYTVTDAPSAEAPSAQLAVTSSTVTPPPPPSADENARRKMLDELQKRLAQKEQVPAPEDVAAPPATATKTPSGLAYVVLAAGKGGAKPTTEDTVKVHYTGWTKDGRSFDSSVKRGEPATFGVTQVIKGWTEGLQTMTVGEKKRFWIPAELAYGEAGSSMRPGAPTGQLTFDVELLEVLVPPKAPADVATPPKDAKKTAGGVFYKILSAGKGTANPTPTSSVTVHYSGWTKDGKLFDSSTMRGKPARLPLGGVIKGWQEGIVQLKVGDKARLWIPGDLAYGEKPSRPGAPVGQLTFDVELLEIH